MQSRVATLARDFFHPLQTTHTFTDELPAAKVVHLLSSDAATSAEALVNPLGLAPLGADTDAGILVTPGNTQRYLVTVHDVFRDRAQAHPKALDTLHHWQLHFMETPIFAEVDFRQTKYTFPNLVAPTRADAWTTTRIIVGVKLFHIFVTFAPLIQQQTGSDADHVLLYLQSPPLAKTANDPPSTSDEARTVAVHNALGVLCTEGYSFHNCRHPDHHGNNNNIPPAAAAANNTAALLSLSIVLHGDRVAGGQRAPKVVWGAFASPQTEDIAGQHVLPVALQCARFLLPAMAAGERILYDIIQPHPLAYLFQIRTIGGWTLTGAVNLHATLDAIQPLFRLRGLSPSPEEEAQVASLTVPAAALARAQLRMRAGIAHAHLGRKYTTDFTSWTAATAPAITRPFRRPGAAPYTFFNTVDEPFTADQMRVLRANDILWPYIQANAGIQILLRALERPLPQATAIASLWQMHQGDLYTQTSLVLLGNTFIDLFAAAHAGSKGGGKLSSCDSYFYGADENGDRYLDAVQAATNGTWVISVLFRALCAVLWGLTGTFDESPKTPREAAHEIRDFKAKCLPVARVAPDHAQSMTTMPVFTPQSILGRLNLCRGLPPNEWGPYLLHLFDNSPSGLSQSDIADIFIRALWVRAAPYSALLEPALRRLTGSQTRIPTAELGATIAQLMATAAEMDPDIKAGYSAGFWFSKPYAGPARVDKRLQLRTTDAPPRTDRTKLCKALTYMLMTADVDNFNTAQWCCPVRY